MRILPDEESNSQQSCEELSFGDVSLSSSSSESISLSSNWIDTDLGSDYSDSEISENLLPYNVRQILFVDNYDQAETPSTMVAQLNRQFGHVKTGRFYL